MFADNWHNTERAGDKGCRVDLYSSPDIVIQPIHIISISYTKIRF